MCRYFNKMSQEEVFNQWMFLLMTNKFQKSFVWLVEGQTFLIPVKLSFWLYTILQVVMRLWLQTTLTNWAGVAATGGRCTVTVMSANSRRICRLLQMLLHGPPGIVFHWRFQVSCRNEAIKIRGMWNKVTRFGNEM